MASITPNGTRQNYSYTPTNSIASGIYDADGNPTALSGSTYTWDGANRLVSFSNAANHVSTLFSYDGLGRLVRVVDSKNGVVVADHGYTWCGAGRCLAHNNRQSGSPVSTQYFAQGAIISGTPYYYVKDRLGSVKMLVTSAGAIASQYTFDPYGNKTVVSGTVVSDVGYAGYFNHAPSGLQFATYRVYDTVHARWLNRDPIAEAGGVNLYSYVDGNPASLVDSFGLSTVSIGITISGTWGPFSVSTSYGVVIDGHGNIGTYSTTYTGSGDGGAGSVGVTVGSSNADTITDLRDTFSQISGSVGAISGDVYTGSSDHGTVTGGDVTVGGGAGASISGGGSYTIISPLSCH